MFIPIIVLSKDGDNDSSMGGGGIDEESNNWSFNIGEDVVELSIWSDRFYQKKKKELMTKIE